jgi:hypothetical protein
VVKAIGGLVRSAARLKPNTVPLRAELVLERLGVTARRVTVSIGAWRAQNTPGPHAIVSMLVRSATWQRYGRVDSRRQARVLVRIDAFG